MVDRLNYVWRVIATAISFASFGVGGALMWVLVFPALSLLVRDQDRRGVYARAIVRSSFAVFLRWMRLLGVLSYEIRGAERLQRRGLLVLANHPTLLDVVFLVSLIPDADCVVRSGLARNLFTRGAVRAAGYISNDGGSRLVYACIASLQSGKNLVIFPEGTRTPKRGVQPLLRGAANIAIRGGFDVTPVLIRCRPPTLAKGEKWYHVPPRRFHVVIEVQADLATAPFMLGTTEAIAARRLTERLSANFRGE
ncbi:MAG: 1-acyl-sn-glycerol-3-phosphate acyltransferase [Lysobacterales bacterium CG17_big_fil_post_rev_8_21_14_2_50_64_11]|nr:MAG: 1-acyl-sn-glycerol-3-phosphate acyltransferase [Xanthomonadales bacterium CG17_big_fil_post_rev_8_21_14_2_50_64_11]PIX59391.1 MAG: 1-acyl-sn-glycerol-3-phosphate acyltransferase [Xanthomonadales bacterium CG_4_10_14_3_um_filter_64_11]